MDPITILKKDHRKVLQLLKQAMKTPVRASIKRKQFVKRINAELQDHTKMEEVIFYPPLKAYKKTYDLILEAYEEHHLVDLILGELKKLRGDDEYWKAKLTVLMENVRHHIQEEEKSLFPLARSVLPKEELQAMGLKMQQFKKNRAKFYLKSIL